MALRKRHPDDISGPNRAVIELAAAMQYELDIQGTDPSLLREKQLEERVDKQLRGGAVSYAYTKAGLQVHSFKHGLGSWFKKEKWWFSAILLTSTFIATFWMIVHRYWARLWFWTWCLGLWFGQFWAFCIGTTDGSRMLIIIFWCTISAIVTIICATQFRY
jgi:hypothetical protein